MKEKISDNNARESAYALGMSLYDAGYSRDTAMSKMYQILSGCGARAYSRSICSAIHAAYDDAAKI